MRQNTGITEEEKWKAVIGCDKDYDGLFYYGVKTTGIFCRPSCKAKPPLKRNTIFLSSVEDAVSAGFRPCKKCRPDLGGYSYEPNKELIKETKKMLNLNYNNQLDFKRVSKEFGVSSSHLIRLFREYCGLTPNAYIMQMRINNSLKLLEKTNIGILEVAYEVGFKSLSSFYKRFKEQVGCTPKEYRKKCIN